MSSPNQRLREARTKAGFASAKDAAESMGMPVSTYIQHESGIRGFPAARAAQYARKFKVTEEWLLYGKSPAAESEYEPLDTVPLLGSVPGGNWRLAVQDQIGAVPRYDPSIPSRAYALKVVGDSMDLEAPEGSTIIIDPEDRDPFPGHLFVVANGDGETTFKQYHDNPPRLTPVSTNPAHREIRIADGDFRIVGRVIWVAARR